MPLSRRRQKPLGPAPLASFDRGLSSECNSFDEGLSNLGKDPTSGTAAGTGRRSGHIGVLCQTSIMEEPTSKVRTRTIACQTDRSAIRDGIRGKQRKSSQSQTSFDQDPPVAELQNKRPNPQPSTSSASPPPPPAAVASSAPKRDAAYKMDSLEPLERELERLPSPSRPSTLDLAKKQKKAPTTFSKVQKLELKTKPSVEKVAVVEKEKEKEKEDEKKRSLLGKKDSIASASGASEKSRSSGFRSPFSRRRDEPGTTSSSRAVSPMLQIRQRIASLSPGRGRKKNVAKMKLEALLTRVAAVEHTGTECMDTTDDDNTVGGGSGESVLNRQRPASMSLRSSPRPANASQSLSPRPSQRKQSHALSKLQALIDRSRLLHVHEHATATANHDSALTTHHADVHYHSPAEPRRRSKSSPPEPEPYLQHRLSIGAVWMGHHGHHGHHHHHHGTLSKTKTPSNPPSPFEEVKKKISIQEDDDDSEDEKAATAGESARKMSESSDTQPQPFHNDDEPLENTIEEENEVEAEIEAEKKIGETLLTTEDVDHDDEVTSSVSAILDKVLRQKAQAEMAEQKKKVQAEREKRQTFKTAPVERPRSQSREMNVVDLNVYVAEAEKLPAPSSEQRIKLNLHLNQETSLDEVDNKPTVTVRERQPDPDDWKRFCEQGLLSKCRSRLERAGASESGEEWADFNKWSKMDGAEKKLRIPMIVETAWTPQEHRILNVTPSPSTVWDTGHEGEGSHGDVDSSQSAFDESFNSITPSINEAIPESSPHTTSSLPVVDTTSPNTRTTTSDDAHVIVILPPSEPTTPSKTIPATAPAGMNSTKPTSPPAAAITATTAAPEPPKQIVPTRKAPAAPTRKAPPPPAPKTAHVIPPPPEPTPEPPPTETWNATTDSTAIYSEADQAAYNAYYYPEYTAEQQQEYYASQGYTYDQQQNNWNYDQGGQEYYSSADYHDQTVSVDYSGGPAAAVTAVLGSHTDFTGPDGGVMSDPTAIDIGNEKSADGHQHALFSSHSSTHHQGPTDVGRSHEGTDISATTTHSQQLNVEHVEHSPLLQPDDESQEDEDDDENEDRATVILNPNAASTMDVLPRSSRPSISSPDASFQPLTESAGDDGSGIDPVIQTKHRRISKVPYTSLDVQDNPDEEDEAITEPNSNNIVPEEETVAPLLAGNQDDLPEPEPESEAIETEPAPPPVPTDPVAEFDPSLYDPAIYDPAGTGYDINSQEYYDYYYGHLAQPVTTESEQYYYPETSAAQPAYEYSTTATAYQSSGTQPAYEYSNAAAESYANTYADYPAEVTSEPYYEQPTGGNWEPPKAASPEWPTYNAYVAPSVTAGGGAYEEAQQYEETYEEGYEYEEETEEEPAYGVSTIPKEKLFDEANAMPFGNLRPEPKKKDVSVPMHLKMAKGLKPSKKKIVNLVTKGKYSSGKKKDLFDEIEQNFSGPAGESANPAQHSEQWLEYQKMTSRVQNTVEGVKQKVPPLPTPTSESEERKQGPMRPPVHTPSKPVEELFSLSEPAEEPAGARKPGPPARPPAPKAKPGRPPPPKKSDVSDQSLTVETPTAPATAESTVSDELADFFGAPIPPTQPEKPAASKSRQQPEPPSKTSSRPVQAVPTSAKAVSTDIKPVARPKAGAVKPAETAPISAPDTKVTKTPSVPVTGIAPKKTSNVDDLFGLFDAPPEAPTLSQELPVQNEPSDPFSTDFNNKPLPASNERVPVTVPAENEEDFPPPPADAWNQGVQSTPDSQTLVSDTRKWNGTGSSQHDSSWEPWGASGDANEAAAVQIVNDAISAAAADHVAVSTPPTAAPPRLPPRPPPAPPRPAAAPPALSRKDMFLQSTSEDSDVTFAATFTRTQDESPTDETAMRPTNETPVEEHGMKVVSQIESMVVRSQPSPTATRKSAQVINSTPWGDESTSTGGFEADFANDPFGDSKPATATQESADVFGASSDNFTEKLHEEDSMLKLVASYKNQAPEKINMNATLLNDAFFDPFATIVPEDSPAPTTEVPRVPGDTDDDFDVWETPAPIRPETLPSKDKAGRRTSTNSNVSRRTSTAGSVQTPLYDEDDSQPMPDFTWDHPQTSWELLLRSPPKKTFSGTRYWKQIHVKLTDTTLQLFNKVGEQKPFHELPLQGNYMVTEIAIQPLDVFTKIHTTKVEYVFYKERVGIRPGQITKAQKGQITKLGLPLEHASQTTELLKFGSLNCRILRDFVHAVEDVLFRILMIRDRAMIYKQEEVQAHVIDEFTARVDKSGIISDRRGRVRVYCLCFVSGMPEVEFGLNDITRKGKEIVGRHDILPIYTEEWIRMENVELHHCVARDEYAKNKVIKFVPPDACFFELARFRVRPPKNRELPLAIRVTFTMEGYRVGVKVEAQTTAYYNRKRAQPCDDIQIRVPIPESWIYLFRTEKLFGYGSKHATSKKSGLIKGMSEKLRTAGVGQSDPSQIAVTSGSARYEHVYRSLVWRISRLPKEGQGAFANHMMTCRLDLNSYDTMPERFEPNAEIEFTMPAATASHTTLRSISATCDEPPEKWVKYLAKYEYVVEIDYKIDRGDVQLYGAGATD